MKRIFIRLLFTGLALVLVLALLGNLVFYITEDRRFRGMQKDRHYQYSFGYPHEELFLPGIENGLVHGILIRTPLSKGLVFFLPGTHSDVEIAASRVGLFLDLGFDLLVMEYRGCGKSTGPTSEQAFYADAALLYDSVKNIYGEERILVVGHSLGGIIGARIASESKPAGLILLASLYSINEKYINRRPWKYRRYDMKAYEYLEKTRVPVYLICGEKDPLLPQSKKLQLHAPNRDSLIIIDDADHLNIFGSTLFCTTIRRILPVLLR